MSLNSKQKKYLRGLGHHLSPVVIVGDKGLSETVVAEIENALDHHELIKVKLKTDREQRKAWSTQISQDCNAEMTHSIGQIACFYRPNPDEPVISLPSS
jgi:RNA-binding protein